MNELTKKGFGLLLPQEERNALWRVIADLIERFTENVSDLPLASHGSREEVQAKLSAFNFENAVPCETAVEWVVAQMATHTLKVAHPSYFGVFNPNPGTVGIAAEWIAAALNPQLASSASGLFCIEVENHLIRFFAKHFGLNAETVEGNFTVGSTEANLTAILCALAHRLPEYALHGVTKTQGLKIYATTETHHSILRSARVSGLGTDAVVELPVDNKLWFDVTALRKQILSDRKAGHVPCMVVGTLGSTSAGVVDPLAELGAIAREEGLWFHVDAAWGGAACLLEEYRALVAGVELSDSIAFDPHKWLSLPMGIGMFLTRHRGQLQKTFGVDQSFYMPTISYESTQTEPYRQSLQWSRRFIGLKLFLSLATHGIAGYQEILRHQVKMGAYLKRRLREEGWTILNETPLPVVCFTRNAIDAEKVSKQVADSGKSWITTTKIQGQTILRAGISNFITQEKDIEVLISLLPKT